MRGKQFFPRKSWRWRNVPPGAPAPGGMMFQLQQGPAPSARGATKFVIHMARNRPGGVVRWREVTVDYSRYVGQQYRKGVSLNVGRIMKKYFVKVEGTRGYYVLKEFLEPDVTDQETVI